jgi:glycosyltransferase involved in cell wall biosynthesis
MRITFVAPGRDLSGGAKVIALYAKKLEARGHEVSIVMPGPPIVPLRRRIGNFVKGRREASSASHYDDISVPIRELEGFRGVRDGDVPDADVILGTWWETVEWINKLSPSKGVKVHFIQGYEAFEHMPKDRVDAVWRLDIPKIAIAQWLVQLGREMFGAKAIHLVSNSVDLQHFDAPPRRLQGEPTVGMLYHTLPTKGVPVAFSAFELLRQRLPRARLLMFGAYHPEGDLPIRSEYHYRPPQDQIPRLYAACDVWLTASIQEGFNLPAIEAMACRCPLVSTPTGRPQEIIVNGYNGYIADSPQALSQALYDVLAASDWERMSANARETVSGYTWADAADRFEEALINIVQAKLR